MEDCLQLLHFHLGSQITNIRQIKAAVIEAARVYVELRRSGAGLNYMDVGGGLGIDYDGSQTDFESSVNYTLQEYANDVVYHIQSVCDEAEVAHPDYHFRKRARGGRLSQRAGVQRPGRHRLRRRQTHCPKSPTMWNSLCIDLQETLQGLSNKNLLESFHDAQQALDSALNLFSLGYLPLQQRSMAESIYWLICRNIQKLGKQLDDFPEELEGLDGLLSDTYFCNFSLFQSMPDSWAVKQLVPHHADPPPERGAFAHGILGDISCDSDGKVDQFIDRRDVKKTLAVAHLQRRAVLSWAHSWSAHIRKSWATCTIFSATPTPSTSSLDENGAVVIEAVIRGDTVREVLDYVQFKSPR